MLALPIVCFSFDSQLELCRLKTDIILLVNFVYTYTEYLSIIIIRVIVPPG